MTKLVLILTAAVVCTGFANPYLHNGKPQNITKGANQVNLTYGADKAIIQRQETNANGTSTTTYVSHDLITSYEQTLLKSMQEII